MRACLRLLVVAVAATTGAGTYRAAADEPPPAPTPPAETTPAPTPPAASAEEVEALKKQNAELRQRVEELSGEMDQVKKLLAEKATPIAIQPPTKKPVVGALEMELYGYVKLDAAYDTSRVSFGDYLRWVESEERILNDNQFNMTANETRLGLRIKGPASEGFRSSGNVEVDFYSFVNPDFTAVPRLRQANVLFEWPNAGFGVLAGQATDVISPLTVPTVNFAVGWWLGDIGFRRPQFRLIKTFKPFEDVELKLEAAATRTVAGRFLGGSEFSADPGADAGFPAIQGRASVVFPGFEKRPVTLGVWGHWGNEEHDLTNTTMVAHHSFHSRSWSSGFDLVLPLTAWLKLQGSGYVGSDLDTYLGGIGQGVNGVLLKSIDDKGIWGAATFGPFGRWVFNGGYTRDDPDNADLTGTGNPATDPRASNQSYFGNVYFSLNSNLQLALELLHARTTYKSVAPGDDWRYQFATIYRF